MSEESLGDRLRRLREAKGLSQSGLAAITRLDKNSVYMVESGKQKRFQKETLQRVAEALDCSPTYLEYGQEFSTEQPDLGAALRAAGLSEQYIEIVRQCVDAFLLLQDREQ